MPWFMSNPVPPCRPFIPHSIEDRAFWQRAQADSATAGFVRAIRARADAAPARPPIPLASDYLAARRTNDRHRIDNYWQVERVTLSALVLRRCLLGIDAADPDDRLLDWLFAFATHPTWAVSAHLPGNDLPIAGAPRLDLAATEMAGVLAETVEVLRPWIDSASQTLATSIIHEIDQRVLEPFVHNRNPSWAIEDELDHRNNWTGVCAGSILAACESLARQGQPRPEARAKALRLLDRFLREAFTPSGECDEGIMYWSYGVSYTCYGLCRLAPDELAGSIDLDRLRQVAAYPGRTHLFETTFYSANDSTTRTGAALSYVPWLAEVTGDAFLRHWLASAPSESFRDVMSGLRVIDSLLDPRSDRPADPPPQRPTQYLEDQQVAIARLPSPAGEMLIALGGGNNGERHNHNDVGHFLVTIDQQAIIPDLGGPQYTTDFFGPRRYTYLAASSRGHCCPVINGHEQRPGIEAAATVLERELGAAGVSFALDATAAYPPEAGLQRWTRRLRTADHQATLTDTFQLAPSANVTHVVWFTSQPQATETDGGLTLRAASLNCRLEPAPARYDVIAVDPVEHRLREFGPGQTLYRVEAHYTAPTGSLEYRTILRPER